MFPNSQGGGFVSSTPFTQALVSGAVKQAQYNQAPTTVVPQVIKPAPFSTSSPQPTSSRQAGNSASPSQAPAPQQQQQQQQQGPTQAQIDAQNAAIAHQQALATAHAQYGDPSMYDSQIAGYNSQISQLDPQQAIGLQNLADQYQKGMNNLNQSNQLNERNYNQGVAQNVHSYLNNRTGILNQTSANANALQRLLGMAGAGNSSAALYAAPYAASKQGSIDLGNAQHVYGENEQNLDTSWADQQRAYKNALDDLNAQNYQGQNGLKASIAQTRAQLLDQIANASVNRQLANAITGPEALAARNPYDAQIRDLQNQITQWGRANPNPVIAAPSINTTPTTLSDYIQAKQAPITQGTPGGAPIDPSFISILSGQKRDQYGMPIPA